MENSRLLELIEHPSEIGNFIAYELITSSGNLSIDTPYLSITGEDDRPIKLQTLCGYCIDRIGEDDTADNHEVSFENGAIIRAPFYLDINGSSGTITYQPNNTVQKTMSICLNMF
jgi:hypothetical protein